MGEPDNKKPKTLLAMELGSSVLHDEPDDEPEGWPDDQHHSQDDDQETFDNTPPYKLEAITAEPLGFSWYWVQTIIIDWECDNVLDPKRYAQARQAAETQEELLA